MFSFQGGEVRCEELLLFPQKSVPPELIRMPPGLLAPSCGGAHYRYLKFHLAWERFRTPKRSWRTWLGRRTSELLCRLLPKPRAKWTVTGRINFTSMEDVGMTVADVSALVSSLKTLHQVKLWKRPRQVFECIYQIPEYSSILLILKNLHPV